MVVLMVVTVGAVVMVVVVSLNFSNNAVHFSLKLREKQVEITYICTYIMHHVYIKIHHV